MLLADSGAFDDYAKSELIDGDVIVMSAQYSLHARVKSRLLVALSNQLAAMGSELEAISEVSVRTSDHGMPEPDIVLTRWRGGGAVPVETVALVIEVSDTTLDTDLGRKADLYAAAGIPEYWVIDLNEDRALTHEYPEGDNYNGQLDKLLGEPLMSATIEGLSVPTTKLLA